MYMSKGQTVVLDVGGQRFKINKTSLLAEQSTYFTSLFDNKAQLAHNTQEDGSIFIDRDPILFRYILTFLRERDFDTTMMPPRQLAELLTEARYFNVTRLVEILDRQQQFNEQRVTKLDRILDNLEVQRSTQIEMQENQVELQRKQDQIHTTQQRILEHQEHLRRRQEQFHREIHEVLSNMVPICEKIKLEQDQLRESILETQQQIQLHMQQQLGELRAQKSTVDNISNLYNHDRELFKRVYQTSKNSARRQGWNNNTYSYASRIIRDILIRDYSTN